MVHLVQVDMIGLQPPKAVIARPSDVMIGGEAAIVRAGAHRLVQLGRQDKTVAASPVNSPKFMVPRANRLTCRPERPRDVYCIEFLFALWTQERLDRATLVHRTIALGDSIER